jgi:eukaryotic-like serine/threonine-protein kinase
VAEVEHPTAPSDTQAEHDDDEQDERALDFLQPSTRPGALGRLAHYEVLEVLGQGGFGTVVRAFDEKLHRMVAIKIMSPQLAATSPARKRFMREARSSAAIRHENVVDIHAIEEKPIPFLVMEYVGGETLQQRLDRNGPLEPPEVLRIGMQIAHGLAAAHAMGKIHRDIKPANILLENGIDRVKITDFGLARAADDASLTQSGLIAGTPMYMAPEQAQGVALDHRADLFSFGSVLYVMCSGRPPFRASTTLAVLKRVADDTPRPIREIIPEIPQWLCDIITRLHAKRPEDRFQNAKEVADVLGKYLTELELHGKVRTVVQMSTKTAAAPVAAPPPRPSPARDVIPAPSASPPPTLPRNPRLAIAAVALFLMMLIGLGFTEATGITTISRSVMRRFSAEGRREIVGDPGKEETKPMVDGTPVTNAASALFNGKDLSGWKAPTRADAWQVEDGLLVGRSATGEAYLFSERGDWDDFHLHVVAKINAVGDSGIFLRTSPDENAAAPVNGFEVHIGGADHPRPTGSLFQQSPVAAAPGNAIKPDEWFTLDVFSQGRRATIKLNGKEVMNHSLDDDKRPQGFLALQAWGPETVVHFKTIEIKKLPGTADPDRRAAEYVLSIGGRIQVNGQSRVLDGVVELPPDPIRLTYVNLSTNEHVNDAGLVHFKDCKNLLALHLEFTKVSDAGLAHFRDCKALLSLNLGGEQVSDAGLVRFKDCKNLTQLRLYRTKVSDAGLACFKDCKNLTILALNNMAMSDAGLAHFKDCKKLTHVDLARTQVSDAGLAQFKDCQDLIQLLLQRTTVTAKGIDELKRALPKCRIEWDGGVIEPTATLDPIR